MHKHSLPSHNILATLSLRILGSSWIYLRRVTELWESGSALAGQPVYASCFSLCTM